MTTSGAI